MKKITHLLIGFFCVATVNSLVAQNHEWAIASGSTFDENGRNLCTDNFGNTFTSGTFAGTIDFDPGPGVNSITAANSFDNFVAKYDASGNLVWVKHYFGNLFLLNEIMAAPSGDLYLVGAFTGTLDADPNAGTSNLISNGSRDIFVIRLSGTGNLVWAKNIGGGGNDVANALTVDYLSNVIVGGYYLNTVDFDPGVGVFNLSSVHNGNAFLFKLDAVGNFAWADNVARTTSAGSFGSVLSIDTDDALNIYYTGFFLGATDLNPDNSNDQLHTSAGAEDIFIGKVDMGGNYNWGTVLGSSGSEQALGLKTDYISQIYLTGFFSGSLDFDPGANTNLVTAIGGIDAFSLVLDYGGNFVAANQMGGAFDDYGYGVEATSDGFLVTGSYQTSFSFFGGNSSTSILGGGGGPNDMFLEKMDFTGNHLWTRTWTGAGTDVSRKVAVSVDEKIYLTGSFQQSVDFDPGIYTNILSATGTSAEYFLLKLKCPSESIVSDTYCYSYTSPSGNHIWSADGTYNDTITNVFGCDSVMTITINSVNNSGAANVQGCGVYYSPSGNYSWSTPGTYMDTIPNMYGCDSILTLSVSIVTVDTTVTTDWQSLQVPALSGATYQWYNCVLGNQLVGETMNTYIPTFNGLYYVEITYNGCTFMSPCHSFNTVGVAENEFDDISIFPNPTSGFVTIKLQNESAMDLGIHDVSGKTVYSGKLNGSQAQIDLGNLAPGLYLLEMSDDKGTYFEELIIK